VKPKHPYVAVAMWRVVFFALVPSMFAQEATPRHTGVPQDWSQHNIVFSRDTLALHPDLIYREPRVLHQMMQRWQVPNFGFFRGVDPLPTVADKSGPHRDWNVTPLGGKVAPFRHAAKFSFDPGAPPSCANDYVVFGLSTVSTGPQANLVAFNNLYSDPVNGGGLCDPPNGPGLKVLFANDITTLPGGRITTSPILSEDGTKIGFVESIPANAGLGITASAVFHVVTWAPGGVIGTAVPPASISSVPFSLSANDSASSPWIDYSSDIVYVGSDNGSIYKITGVFHGTPTLSGPPWPVVVSSNLHLTSPVLDSVLGMLMVGSANGNLYQINVNASMPVAVPLSVGAGPSSGIVAPPIVDVTNGTTFVVSANDGTSAVLVEANTATMVMMSKGQIGKGAASPGGTALNIHSPAVSNLYFNNPSSGEIRVCGTGPTDATPWQYAFGFTGSTMDSIPSLKQQIPTNPANSTAARCAGFTEFFNPNAGGSLGTDYFFFGLTKDCTAAGGDGGCVAEFTNADPSTILRTTVSGGPSGIIVDNYSTLPQASSIYFTAEGINTAYKFTQNGLN
jgi:hypothetical protein